MVKLNSEIRPITSLIIPLQGSRVIETPQHAARFVSLIPFERIETPGGKILDIWHSIHAFIAKGSGDSSDHSILLCSLLLGFGIDAYVCIGTTNEGPHCWVLSRTLRSSQLFIVTFWESLTGQRFEVDDPRVSKFYKTINCVFNNKSFYANSQSDDRVSYTEFDFSNDLFWKSMSSAQISQILPYNFQMELKNSQQKTSEMEYIFESKLKRMIRDYRSSINNKGNLMLGTTWDDCFAYLHSPAIANYEVERICGKTFGSEDFKNAIAHYIPEGHTYKAFPVQIQTLDEERLMSIYYNSKEARDILDTKGDSIKFALRVKIICYAEDFYAVLCVIAVQYREV